MLSRWCVWLCVVFIFPILISEKAFLNHSYHRTKESILRISLIWRSYWSRDIMCHPIDFHVWRLCAYHVGVFFYILLFLESRKKQGSTIFCKVFFFFLKKKKKAVIMNGGVSITSTPLSTHNICMFKGDTYSIHKQKEQSTSWSIYSNKITIHKR